MSECSQGAIERAERAIQKLLERANSVPSIESDSEIEKRRKFRQKLPTSAADFSLLDLAETLTAGSQREEKQSDRSDLAEGV